MSTYPDTGANAMGEGPLVRKKLVVNVAQFTTGANCDAP